MEAFYVHPSYDTWDIENDIALIKVKKSFNFSDSCQPACLPAAAQNHYDGTLKVRSNLNSFKGLKPIDLNLEKFNKTWFYNLFRYPDMARLRQESSTETVAHHLARFRVVWRRATSTITARLQIAKRHTMCASRIAWMPAKITLATVIPVSIIPI